MSDWTRPPIERSTRFATTVNGLDEAFACVMAHLELVDDLHDISIRPVWSSADDFGVKRFSVVVSGMAELPAYEPGVIA